MIEKIMKAVKSGSKKRGRNITIGAVVGFLLSCTIVMGAVEGTGLNITTNGGIEFSKDNISFTPGEEGDPYIDNSWDESTKTYTNNSTISEEITDSDYINSYGLNVGIAGEGISKIVNKGMINGYAKVSNTVYDAKAYGINISLSQNGNVKMESITNDGLINAETISGSRIYSYGIKVSLEYGVTGSIGVDNITNDGLIIGNSRDSSNEPSVYGISIGNSVQVGKLINNGLINTYMPGGASTGTGISVSGTLSELINNGLINETSVDSYAITIGYYGGTVAVTNITNNGLISGYLRGYNECSGIRIDSTTLAGALKNIGTIKGDNGIKNGGYLSGSTVNNLINNGVIYGKTNAVKNGGTITNSNNYGILASGNSSASVVDGLTIAAHNDSGGENKIKNYGLAFADMGSGVYKNYDNSSSNFGVIYSDENIAGVQYDIINIRADVDGSTNEIKDWKSLGIKDGKLYSDAGDTTGSEISSFSSNKQYILNGIEDTLKVIGANEGNRLNNSIINAYKTAVKFDNAAEGKLTLSGTTVNGGADGSDVVVGGSNSDTLILEDASIINGNINMGAEVDNLSLNSGVIVNGTVKMGDGNDVLDIVSGGRINGTLDRGIDNDVLNFNPAVMRASNNDEIKIFHNISGFENMNIGTNITVYEKTIGTDGKTMDDLKISDAEVINIKTEGTLTLRIDSTNTANLGGIDKIIGHALYGNTGTISSEGGKLLLALNGAGNESVINFGSTELDNSLITGSRGNFDTTSKLHTVEKLNNKEVAVTARWDLPNYLEYQQLNKIYQGIVSVEDLIGNFNVDNDEKLSTFLGYLNDIYAGNPYSYSSELSRKSAGMFRDIVTENIFKPEANKWMIYGGLTHVDGGTKDTYYGKGYYTYDIGSSDMDADTKITGAYMLGEYGVSDTLTSGVVIGGNKLKSDLSNGSKVDGSAMYLGAYAKKYIGNLKVTAGAGFQYGDYDADRLAVNKAASSTGTPVIKYSDNYNDITYDIYLNGRYSHNIGDNLFLEPYGTLSYTYIDQDGADEGNQTLAIETDSKSFDYTVGKAGIDLKKVIPHEKGKSTLSAGVSCTKILDGADEEHITGRFKGGTDFDILVAHKNEHSIGVNAKYALELENGVLFDVKGTYAVERDSHNGAGKNKAKGEWIVGAGLGYKF